MVNLTHENDHNHLLFKKILGNNQRNKEKLLEKLARVSRKFLTRIGCINGLVPQD